MLMKWGVRGLSWLLLYASCYMLFQPLLVPRDLIGTNPGLWDQGVFSPTSVIQGESPFTWGVSLCKALSAGVCALPC